MKMLEPSRCLLRHLLDTSSSSRPGGQGTALVHPVMAAFSSWPIPCHFTPAVAPGFPEAPNLERLALKCSNRYSPERRERAVRLVLEPQGGRDTQWAAIISVWSKTGCSAETLRKWVWQAERDQGRRPGLTSDERERLKALEWENLGLRRANEILRKASAYFAQAELDRRPKP